MAPSSLGDPFIGANEAAARLGVGRHSVVRWCKFGVRGRDGVVVKLAGRRVGGAWKTTASAIAAFLEALNGHAVQPTQVRTPAEACRASMLADRELIARGL